MNSKQTFVVASMASLALASTALAGGIERFCPSGTGGGASVIETWASPTAVPWRIAGAGAGNFPAPGFAHIQCAGNPPNSNSPVAQSVFAAVSTWNTANLGGSVPNVSAFSFANPASPSLVGLVTHPLLPANEGGLIPMSFWNTNRGLVGLSQLDGQNTITLWDGAGSFTTLMGGPAALAVTGVNASLAGTITEVDIALNARGPFTFSGAPTWSFVEVNAAVGVTMATQPVLSVSTFVPPIAGFADLQGVLTHELGHFAGLGHSLVDSTISPTASQVPTMFAIAQAEPNFSATLGLHTGGTPGSCNFNFQSVSTTLEFFGRSASDLTLDDKWAIAEGYPLPAGNPYWTNTGVLTGTVFNTSSVAQRGISVIAVDAANPNGARVGTLTHDAGTYRITGLPPGNYFVMAQQVDRGTAGAFFANGDVPNYAQNVAAFGCVGAVPPLLATEWFDASETNPEFSNMNANSVAVVAGGTTTAGFKLNSDINHLTVSATANPASASPRGVQLNPGGTATFFVTGGVPGSTAFLFVDLSRTFVPFGTQVGEVNPVAVFSGTVSGTGVATIAIPVNTTHLHNNLFAQGLFGDAAGNLIVTNSVNFWVN